MRPTSMRTRFRRAAAVAAVAAVAVGTPAASTPAGRDSQPSLYELPGGSPVPGSALTVVRTDRGLSFTVTTARLVPGNAYTVWVMLFNHPEFCTGSPRPGVRCGLGDFDFLGGDPRVRASVTYGAGHVVGESGRASFAGRQNAGDTSTALFGPGLTNPRGAEVQVRIRDHGAASPGLVDDQVRTFNGGCEPGQPHEGKCQDVQTSGA